METYLFVVLNGVRLVLELTLQVLHLVLHRPVLVLELLHLVTERGDLVLGLLVTVRVLTLVEQRNQYTK